MTPSPMAMFPLGSVLFPGFVLPLHVFEPRYRRMIHDVLGLDASPEDRAAGGREFGVCLIERGAEVGGQDVRTSVGTVARIQEATAMPDGRWGIVSVGLRRIRVERWLPDDPYPRAEVEDLPDPTPSGAELELLEPVRAQLRTALALAAELGEAAAPATVELSDDPVRASYQIAALAPIPMFDKHALLAADTVGVRLARLDALLADAVDFLGLRLGNPGSDPNADPAE